MSIMAFLLAYSRYREHNESLEEFLDIVKGIGILLIPILIIVLVIFIVVSLKDIKNLGFRNWVNMMFSKECRWCGERIPPFSEQKEIVDGYRFCSLKCCMKYRNEKADLIDRSKTAGKSENININDRNKYLSD